MKRTMDEYKDSMNNIFPSDSFISDTEALMKKVRDENAADSKRITVKTEDININIMDNDRTSKIKRWTIGVSAAAAAVICVVAIGSAGRVNVVDNMVTEEPSETVSDVSEHDVSETEVTVAETKEETSVSETSSETDIISETSVTDNEETRYPNGGKLKKNEQNDRERDDSQDEEEEINSDNFVGKSPDSVNVFTEKRIVTHEDIPTPAADTVISAEVSESYPETGTDNSSFFVSETPMYIPYSEMEEEYEYEEEAEEGVFEEYFPEESEYYFEDSSSEAEEIPVMLLSMSAEENYDDADTVYVPDSITELEKGEYYLTVESGFDSVTSYGSYGGTATGISSQELRDETVSSDILNTIAAISADCTGTFSEKEQTMNNFRYSINICSSDINEEEAMLFEIRFDSSVLQINRYDNGTVSSEVYYLEADDYEELDLMLEELLQ